MIKQRIEESLKVKNRVLKDKSLIRNVLHLSQRITASLKNGGKVIFFGNGGSASQAQHFACEFVVRFKRERIPLPAISLADNISILTAASNDYSFREVFRRQILSLGKKEDVAIGLSTSGNSPNVILALKQARKMGIFTAGFTGSSGGKVKKCVDLLINIPSRDTARIQEAHLLIGHIICELVEKNL